MRARENLQGQKTKEKTVIVSATASAAWSGEQYKPTVTQSLGFSVHWRIEDEGFGHGSKELELRFLYKAGTLKGCSLHVTID